MSSVAAELRRATVRASAADSPEARVIRALRLAGSDVALHLAGSLWRAIRSRRG